MKHIKFIFLYIFNESFRMWHLWTLHYALISYDKNRGNCASDALLFKANFFEKIFTRKEQEKIKKFTREYRSPLSEELKEILKRFVEQNSKLKSTNDILPIYRAKKMLEENTADVELDIIDEKSEFLKA